MLFNSTVFLFGFLPVTVLLFWLLVRRSTAAAVSFLAIASYCFYLYGDTVYPWILGSSILFNYLCGHGIRRNSEPLSRAFLVFGVVVDLLVLGFFKYANFFLEQVDLATRHTWHLSVTLPIGISFYTFTQIAYLIDTYRDVDSEANLSRYALFITYFPHLIAGPIIHHKEMMPQFLRPRLRNHSLALYRGLCLLSIGLAKKVLIADPCGSVASSVFNPAASGIRIGFVDSWVAAIFYTAQIYFDFSGYSDMALAVSLMLGIRLPVNFNSPYKARSIIEFWRRWHITLSRFLRDYLYFSLGGNRKGRLRQNLNLMITMVLGGLWHGAGWGFLLWGTLHGVALLIAHVWHDAAKNIRRFRLPSGFTWALTLLFVAIAWVPFRAVRFGTTMNIWEGMLGLHGLQLPNLVGFRQLAALLHRPVQVNLYQAYEFPVLALAIFLALVAPNSQQLLRRFRVGMDSRGYDALPAMPRKWKFLEARFDLRTALIAGILLGVAVRSVGSYSEFIYFHF